MDKTIDRWTDPDGNGYAFKDTVARAQNRATIDKMNTETADRKSELDIERKRIDNLIKELPATAGEYQQSKLVLHSYDNTAVKCTTTSGNYTNVPAFTTDQGGPLSSLYTKKSNYQIAVNKSGLYLFELRIHVNSLIANKRVELAPFVNDTRNAALASSYNTAGNFTLTQVAALPLWLSANDTVDFRIAPIEAAEVRLQLGDVLVYAIDWEDKFKIPDYTGYAAETKDIRTGADGTVYGTAGEAVRKQIGNLTEDLGNTKDDLRNYLHVDSDNIFNASKATKNKYINSNGEELDSSSYELSEYIPVPFTKDNFLYFNKDAISSEYSDYKGVHQIILYDSNKIFIKRVACIGASYGAFNQANAKYMRLMIGSNTKELMVVVSNKYDATFSPTYIPYGGAYTETFKNEVNETLKEYANSEEFKDNINFVIDKRQENNTERPLEHIIRDGGLTRIFRTAGVVGDSLSSGCMEYKDSSGNALGYDRYEFSWIQQMRGICGFDKAENFSVGGLTSKTFWTTQSQKVKNLREDGANHKCQLYFIALGVNDIADTTMEVGTPNDISNDSSTTFYGYYSRIIKLIQRHQPKARIFLVGLPNHNKMTIWGKRFTDFKNAIADMVNHFNFVYYLDLYQYESAYDSEFQKIYFNGFHENALGYARTAWVISSYVDWHIRHNYEEFREVGFIGTDYHYYE